MRYIEYEDKETKKKERAVYISDTLALMMELEQFNGTTAEKIVDNYYELKRSLRDILVMEEKEKKVEKE
ncbi:hypothetical protein LCGC14_1710450 [marine sediment metagenome]|uniref:Uncharacterized protein n=1 Tax=marine sediment metagenome TaxID=412755 RepID=A0A0F9KFH1_9ZZZZ